VTAPAPAKRGSDRPSTPLKGAAPAAAVPAWHHAPTDCGWRSAGRFGFVTTLGQRCAMHEAGWRVVSITTKRPRPGYCRAGAASVGAARLQAGPKRKDPDVPASFWPNGVWLSPDGAVTCYSTVPYGTPEPPAEEERRTRGNGESSGPLRA
jgi:hypothetical protein